MNYAYQVGDMQQGDFKKALQTIAFIMNGSIDLGTTLNLDSEAPTSFNSGTRIDLNSQVSTEEDSDTVSSSFGDHPQRFGFRTSSQASELR